jgi:PAS domain S-box-containing protein
MLKTRSIAGANLLGQILVLILFAGLAGYFWLHGEYSRFKEESRKHEVEFIDSARSKLEEQLVGAIDLVANMRGGVNSRIRDDLRERVRDAHGIAARIYKKNAGKLSSGEIQNLILETLQYVRYRNGREYYFVNTMSGLCLLDRSGAGLTGKNIQSRTDQTGKYVHKEMAGRVLEKEEGCLQHYWPKPGVTGKEYPKLSYVMVFRPFDWYIGAGEYLDEVEAEIRREVQERLREIRFGGNGYIFVIGPDGTMLSHPDPESQGKNFWNYKDADGVYAIRELLAARGNPAGVTVRYRWKKPGTSTTAPKMSFARYYPDWGWTMGTGVYLDDVNRQLDAMLVSFKERVLREVLSFLLIFSACLAAAFLAAALYARHLRKEIRIFLRFFQKGAETCEQMDAEALAYSEFRTMAHFANHMAAARNKARDALLQNQAMLESILRAAPVGIGLVHNRVFSWTNAHVLQMTGRTGESLEGQSGRILYPSQEEFERVGGIKYREMREKGIGTIETRWIRRDGEVLDVLLCSTPLAPGDESKGILFTALDITAQKRAAVERERLVQVIEATSDMVGTAGMDGEITYMNAAGKRMAGWTEAAGRPIGDAHPQWAYRKIMDEAMPAAARDGVWVGETALLSPEGVEFPTSQVIMVHKNAEGKAEYCSTIIRDISEHKRSEEALQGSERKFRAVFDQTFQHMALLDPEGRLLDANNRALESCGLTAGQARGGYLWDAPCWEHAETSRKVVMGAVRKAGSGQFARRDTTHSSVDGTIQILDFSVSPVRDEDGAILYLIYEGRDITELKKAEREARAFRDQLNAVIKAVPIPLFAKDKEGRFLLYNTAYGCFFGVSKDELIGMTAPEHWMDRESVARHRKDIELMSQDGTAVYEDKVRNARGDWRDIEHTKGCFHDEYGAVAGMVGTLLDLTEIKRSQQSLMDSEKRYRTLFESAGDAILLLRSGYVVDCNTKALDLFKVTPQEIIGRAPHHFSPETQPDGTPSRDMAMAHLGKVRESEAVSFTWRHRRSDGEDFDAEILLSGMDIAGQRHVMTTVRDVTDRNRSLRENQERFLRARAHQAALIHMATHEPASDGDFALALDNITEQAAQALNVARVGVWLFSSNGAVLRCLNLHSSKDGSRADGMTLTMSEYPGYLNALATGRVIDAHDAQNDPRTNMFRDSYLAPLNITSMLDAAVRVSGKVVGVVCHEHIGTRRDWHDDEIAFAGEVADQVAHALMSAERRRAEEALRESERFYRSLFDLGMIGMAALSPGDGAWTEMNDSLCLMLGTTREELRAAPWHSRLHPDDKGAILAAYNGLFDGTCSQAVMDARLLKKDGAVAHVMLSMMCLMDADGNPEHLFMLFSDITERRRMEIELQNESSKLRDIIELNPYSIQLLDEKGYTLKINKAHTRLFGSIPPPEYSVLDDPVLRRMGLQSGMLRVGAGEIVHFPEFRYDPHDVLPELPAKPVWIRMVGFPIFGHDGKVINLALMHEDVTERRRSQEMLRWERDFSSTVLDTVASLVVVLDREGRVVTFNRACEKACGYSYKEVRGGLFLDYIVPPEERAFAESLFEKLRTEGNTVRAANYWMTQEGSRRFIEWTNTVLRKPTGEVEYVVVAGQDVTEKRRAGEELARAQALLFAAIEQSPAGILIADAPDVKIRVANSAALGIRGQSALPLTDIPVELHPANWQTFHPDGRPYPPGELPLSRAVLRGENAENEEVIIRRSDGEDRWVLANAAPVKDEQGDVIAGVVVFPDITERKRSEEEIRRLRNYLANIVNSMPSVLVGVDPEGRVEQWNREAERTTGIPESEARDRGLAEVFPQLANALGMVRQAIRERAPQKFEKVARTEDGETRFSDITVFPLVVNGIKGAVIRMDDVTDRVRIEEMMIQTEKMLTVGGLAAGMAHEINNPLAGMLQNAQVVINRSTRDIPANHKAAREAGTTLDAIRAYMEKREIISMLSSIRASGERAAQIVQNMLDFSRKSDYHYTRCDLRALLDKTVELASNDYDLKKKYDFKRIEIVRDYDKDIPDVPCEATKIQQVLLNLLKNGAQAMAGTLPDSNPPRFILRVKNEDDMARLEIEDNGPGIPGDIRKRVFEPFFTTKTVGVGTGLGLSVSYFIVTENHGGTLQVDSAPGEGARFIIRLPKRGKEEGGT